MSYGGARALSSDSGESEAGGDEDERDEFSFGVFDFATDFAEVTKGESEAEIEKLLHATFSRVDHGGFVEGSVGEHDDQNACDRKAFPGK